jgi:hypothetical protein
MEKFNKIAVEVIYDNCQENIIGYNELDPETLTEFWDTENNRLWVQYSNDPIKRRILTESQVLTNY